MKSLFKLTFIVLLIVFATYSMIFFSSSTDKHPQFSHEAVNQYIQHPFKAESIVKILLNNSNDPNKILTANNVTQTQIAAPQEGWADLIWHQDLPTIADCPAHVNNFKFHNACKNLMPFSDLEKLNLKLMILNIRDDEEGIDEKWIPILKKIPNWKQRILIYSNVKNVVSALKEREPFFLYAESQAGLVKFKIFESLFLTSAAQINLDGFIAPLKLRGIEVFTQPMIRELQRRGKFFVVSDVSENEVNTALELRPLGILLRP